jgi:chromosome segregation protein
MVAHMHNGSGRRSRLRNLFAERRVHVRNGHESRYVVLSPTLQAGVAAGALALVALLALTSYNAISGRLDLAARERELAALGADKALAERAADQAQALQQRNAAAEAEIARLTEALAQTQAQARDDGEASARLAALQTELDTATARNRELAAALAEARAAGQAQAAQAGAAPSAEIEALRAEVTGLRAEIDRLEREAESLRRSAAQAREALGALQAAPAPGTPPQAPDGGAAADRITIAADPAAQEVRRLQQDLADAHAAIDALSAVSERAEQLGSLVAAPETTVDVASDAPSAPVILPSPPAPR